MIKTIAKNKRALFDYEVLETYEVGIVLSGAEVKAIRSGKVNLKGSYIKIVNSAAWVENMHISPYQQGNQEGYEPTRKRKLLLNGKEISYLIGAGEKSGKTVLPLEIFAKRGLLKMKIGLCASRKKYDKRELLKKRTQLREIKRERYR